MSNSESILRSIPQNTDAERGVISSAMQAPNRVFSEYGWLTAEYFYDPVLGRIFSHIAELHQADKPIDLITVTSWIEDRGDLERVGGAGALTDLFVFVPTASNVGYYIGIMTEKFRRRKIIEECLGLIDRAYDDTGETDTLLDDVEAAMMRLRTDSKRADALLPIGPTVMEALDRMDAAFKSRGRTIGQETGIVHLDRMTGGFREGHLIIIAARPSMGKTAIAMQIAEHIATERRQLIKGETRLMKKGDAVAIFSLEMPAVELMERQICSNSKVNLQRMRDGFMAKGQMDGIARTGIDLSKKSLYIDDTAGLSIQEFRSRARRAVVKYNVRAIVVDYLQLMRSTTKRGQENRQIEISEISGGLKACAKELNLPIIALSQLGREAETRNGPPKLSDLRESGSIEQDADIVIFPWRPKKSSAEKDERQAAEVIIGKQRNGPVGGFAMRFLEDYARFVNVDKEGNEIDLPLYSNDEEKRQ